MRACVVGLVCLALLLPQQPVGSRPFGSETGIQGRAGTRLRSCFVQEVHAPFPRAIIEQSLPPGFRVAPYGSLPEGALGDSATTLFECRLGHRTVRETWAWAATIPPPRYRDRKVDGYGFLIKAFADKNAPLGRAERRCMRYVFEPARIGVTTTEAAGVQVAHSTTVGEWYDEMRTEVTQMTTPPERTRYFARGTRGVTGYDLVRIGGSSRSGSGTYVQRGGAPQAGVGSVAVAGYFAGTGFTTDDGSLLLEARGRHTCLR